MTNAALASIISAEFIPVSEETVRNCQTRLNLSVKCPIRTFDLTEKPRQTRWSSREENWSMKGGESNRWTKWLLSTIKYGTIFIR
jgi:hypothetical protein